MARLYHPDPAELDFTYRGARGDSQRLTLLLLLKCHQHLGYLPLLKDIPAPVVEYLRGHLHLSPDVVLTEEVDLAGVSASKGANRATNMVNTTMTRPATAIGLRFKLGHSPRRLVVWVSSAMTYPALIRGSRTE